MPFETSLLPNILGFIGVGMNVGWPFLRGRASMLTVQALGAFAFASHYLLVDAVTGALMASLVGIQAFLAIPLGTRPGFRKTYLATLPLIAVGMIQTWHGPASAFAAIGMALVSVGRYQTNLLLFRLVLLVCIPFWAVHNVIVGSIPGLSSDALGGLTGSWMLWVNWKRRTEVAA